VSLGRAASTALPASPGVYRFRDGRGRALYLGRAATLRSRVGSYWGDLGDRRHLAPMIARVAAVEAVVCDSEHEAAWLERNLLERELLPYNRIAGGAEAAVCIAVASSPTAPGLAVVHADGLPADGDRARPGVRYFGPYLGGVRVRRAVAGLQRIYPLGYAGEGQVGAVAEMARRRGVGPSDRAALLRSVRAVLERDPVAVADVRAQLTGRRDVAAAAERYELAERIQAELAALDWVVCPQRAAVLDRVNATVAGWSDGLLVKFEVAHGSLRGWQQLPATQAQATHLLDVTPPGWREFAHRNAALASRLAAATAS
jgi:excinuclease ABC subunit C